MVQKWNLEQEVVVAYYAIRNIRYDSITAIMARKFNTNRRTRKQIVHKVKCLRSQGVLPRDARGSFRLLNGQDWMLKHTDRWILRTVGKERLDILLDHDGKTAVIIDDMNNLDQFAKIMHIDDGRNMYWPGPFNLSSDLQADNDRNAYYYYDFQPYQSPNDLYQPENTGGMVNMNAMASSYSDNFPQYQSPYHLGHRGQPEDMGRMVNMNFMASSDSDRLQPYQLPCLQPYQSPDHLGYLDQPDNMGWMDDMNAMTISDSDDVQVYQSSYHLDHPRPYQSPDHLGYLDQPDNMSWMDDMNAMTISDGDDVQVYQSSYHLDHLRPYQSPHDPVHLDQPENMGWMDNMNAMASSDGAGNPGSMTWAEEMDSMDPYHAERLTF